MMLLADILPSPPVASSGLVDLFTHVAPAAIGLGLGLIAGRWLRGRAPAGTDAWDAARKRANEKRDAGSRKGDDQPK